MRRKVLPATTLLWGTLAAVFFLVSIAPAQPASPASASNADLGGWLQRGRQLESERRWGEAMLYYEDGLRQFPAEHGLQRRYDYTRLHYDLARRYSDRSYRDLLTRLSFTEGLGLYSEVLLKVQAHYVDAPRWKDLVDQGTNDLEVALGEPTFLLACRANFDAQRLDDFRQELRRLLASRGLETRNDACDAVTAAAGLAQQRLGIDPLRVVLEYTCGAANCLDPYSTYLTPDQLAEVYSQIKGSFVGLGVELKPQDESLLIVRVIPGSPAQRAGLQAAERIVAVDGRTTRELTPDRAANLLQGEAGTSVELTLVGTSQPARRLTVRRERVEVPSIDQAQILDRATGAAYLRLTCFQETTSHDLERALWDLYRAGMRSLIIDLRGNPGGLLVTAVEVADKFLDQGVIVSTRGRTPQENVTYTAHAPGTWRVPLVLLIDQDSASAAEIFAGAIQDHGRGTLVGRRSYGKGSVQGIFPLNVGGAGVRLTTAKFYSPAGRPYSGVGIEPNIVVRQTARPIDGSLPAGALSAASDPVLATALQVTQQFMAQR